MQKQTRSAKRNDEISNEVHAMPGINVMFWNCQGMSGKMNELRELLRIEEIDIVCISETHLTNNITINTFPNYHTIRQDRHTHLGGLVTLVRHGIKFSEINKGHTVLLEYIGLLIHNEDEKIEILNTYLPGGADRARVITNLKNDLTLLLNRTDHAIFLVGDLNAKHKQWNNKKHNAAGKILYDFTQNNDYSIYFTPDNTYCPLTDKKSPSTIDILISNDKISCTSPFVKNILNSDHVPVFFRIRAKHTKADNKTTYVKNYRKADWYKYRKSLNTILTPLIPILTAESLTNEQIDEAVDIITSATITSTDISIPTEPIKNGLFLSNELKAAFKQRNYYRRRWVRHHRTQDKDSYNLINREIKRMTATESTSKFNRIIEKCVPGDQTIYKLIKARSRRSIPPLYDNNAATRLYDDEDKCRILADHFKKMHNNTLEKKDMIFTAGINNTVNTTLNNLTPNGVPTISSREIHDMIKRLKNGKAPGPDSITVTAIKNYTYIGYELLTKLYNECLRNGHYPKSWKSARTIPVHKAGKDANDKTSYRPISLLPIFAKLFDKIINAKLTTFNEEQNIIPDNQFGFRQKHSTSHGLLYLYKNAKTELTNTRSTGILSFDIEKAFDRVWHCGLLYKMIKHKYPDYLIVITKSFLTDRQFRVCIGSAESATTKFNWGVPQGSALSPTLYNIFISDIPTIFTDDTRLQIPVQIGLYADDTILFTSSRLCNTIEKRLQLASKTVYNYYAKWKIKINNDKTSLTYITKRKTKQIPSDNLVINNADIPWSSELKYLGLTLDKQLTLKPHILTTITKTNAIIRLLYPFINRNSLLENRMKVHLYRTYLRPVLTYAAPIVVQAATTNLQILARKQNQLLRMALNISWESHTSNKRIESLTKIDNLNQFIEKLSIKFINSCSLSTNQIIQFLGPGPL